MASTRCIVGRTAASAPPMTARVARRGRRGPPEPASPAAQGVPSVARLQRRTPDDIRTRVLAKETASPTGTMASPYP